MGLGEPGWKTGPAAGITGAAITEEEVLDVTSEISEKFKALVVIFQVEFSGIGRVRHGLAEQFRLVETNADDALEFRQIGDQHGATLSTFHASVAYFRTASSSAERSRKSGTAKGS